MYPIYAYTRAFMLRHDLLDCMETGPRKVVVTTENGVQVQRTQDPKLFSPAPVCHNPTPMCRFDMHGNDAVVRDAPSATATGNSEGVLDHPRGQTVHKAEPRLHARKPSAWADFVPAGGDAGFAARQKQQRAEHRHQLEVNAVAGLTAEERRLRNLSPKQRKREKDKARRLAKKRALSGEGPTEDAPAPGGRKKARQDGSPLSAAD